MKVGLKMKELGIVKEGVVDLETHFSEFIVKIIASVIKVKVML